MRSRAHLVTVVHASGQVLALGPKCRKLPWPERLSVNACGSRGAVQTSDVARLAPQADFPGASSSPATVVRYSVGCATWEWKACRNARKPRPEGSAARVVLVL